MPPESPITLEDLQQRLQELRRKNEDDRLRYEQNRIQMHRKLEFDRSYYEIRDRVDAASHMIAWSATFEYGSVRKMDELYDRLAGRGISTMGYLSTERGRIRRRNAVTKPEVCVIL